MAAKKRENVSEKSVKRQQKHYYWFHECQQTLDVQNGPKHFLFVREGQT
jgi:hypothetical protein